MIKVSEQSTVTSLAYNGLGQRLNMDAAGVIVHYVLDGDQPLAAESARNTTFFLYGRGPIGEKTTTWNYSLPDGTNTPRQLSDPSGNITLSARYTPWGDTLELNGTGNFTFGYIGGILDAATGLLYVGNGQYYDPATGRFLTRGVNPNSPNPYVPWNPIGAIIGPLALFSLVARRKKANPYLLMLLMLVVLPVSIGMACGFGGSETAAPTVLSATEIPPPPATQTPSPTAPLPPTPSPTSPCEDCTPTPTPTPININDYIIFEDGWTEMQQDVAMTAIRKVNERLLGDESLSKFFQVFNISTSTPLRFYKMSDAPDNGCAAGPHLIKCDPDLNLQDPRLIVHELGHVLSLNNPARNLYGDLLISENAIVDDLGQWVTGLHPSGPDCQNNQDPNSSLGIRCAATSGNQYKTFERTFRGYTGEGIPHVYHGTSFGDWRTNDHEDYADMFMNWTYNTFDYDASAYNAGTKRYDWMDERMSPFIG